MCIQSVNQERVRGFAETAIDFALCLFWGECTKIRFSSTRSFLERGLIYNKCCVRKATHIYYIPPLQN